MCICRTALLWTPQNPGLDSGAFPTVTFSFSRGRTDGGGQRACRGYSACSVRPLGDSHALVAPARRHGGACLLSGLPKQCSLSPDATCSPLPAFLPLSSVRPLLPFPRGRSDQHTPAPWETLPKPSCATSPSGDMPVLYRAESCIFSSSSGLPAIPGPHLSRPPQVFPISVFLVPVAGGPWAGHAQQLYHFLNNLHSRPPNHGSKTREGAAGDSHFRGIIPSFKNKFHTCQWVGFL